MLRHIALVLFCWLLSVSAEESRPLVVAHRGASHDAPENTMAAFHLAWEQGADAIEADFYLTSEEQIVCTHDETTKRFSENLTVANSTLEQLQKLDVGSWKDPRWKNERMPSLQQVLRTVPTGKHVFIEVKCGPEILPALKRELAVAPVPQEQLTIISFDKAVIVAVKQDLPEIRALWLVSFKRSKVNLKYKPSRTTVLETLRVIQADGLDGKAVGPLNAEMVGVLAAEGFETHCWTVNDPAKAQKLAEWGVQSITTDKPALIKEALGQQVPQQ